MKDRICPNSTSCNELYSCNHSIPHKEINGCSGFCSEKRTCVTCIKIPDMWLDKGLQNNNQDVSE